MSVKVKVDIKSAYIARQVQHDDAFWTYVAGEWHRLYTPYVPMVTGMLYDTKHIQPKRITHTQPYAHYQYTRVLNHDKSKHPLATDHWDLAAIPTQQPKLCRAAQRYIDSGRLKIL